MERCELEPVSWSPDGCRFIGILSNLTPKELSMKFSFFANACAVLCLVGFPLFDSAQTLERKKSEIAAGHLDFTKLTFELEAPKGSVLLLEPIPLTMKLSNQTQSGIFGHLGIGFVGPQVKLIVTKPSGATVETDQLSPIQVNGAFSQREISPGESREVTDVLSVNLDTLFNQPGDYQIQAAISGGAEWKELRSNPVTINLQKPVGLELTAFKFIQDSGGAGYFFTGLPLPKGDADAVLLEFVGKFSDTGYGSFANYAMGIRYLAKKNFAEARFFLEKVQTSPEFTFSKEVKEQLQKIEAQQ